MNGRRKEIHSADKVSITEFWNRQPELAALLAAEALERQLRARVQRRHFPVFIRPKTCEHATAQCALTTTDLCCYCMDKRPMSATGRYDIYVDGRGTVNEGTRWTMYCDPCKEFWDLRTFGQRSVNQRVVVSTAELSEQQRRARERRNQRIRNALGTAEEISSEGKTASFFFSVYNETFFAYCF